MDIAGGLPEVIYTSEGNAYLHLPGVIVAESAAGETRYLLSDGLGSVRQGVDELGAMVVYNEFDPYGNPKPETTNSQPYGFTGEWWQDEVGLLHLRARWYSVGTGTFLSKDIWEGDELQPLSFNGWSYVEGNVINLTDPTGKTPWYGVEIDDKFSEIEVGLIKETIKRYVDFLGGKESVFRKNVALDRVEQSDNIYITDYLGGIIRLAPNLYHPLQDGRIKPFSMHSQGMFPNVNPKVFPNQEVVFKFVLAHEITHAFSQHKRNVFLSFDNEFWPGVPWCFPLNLVLPPTHPGPGNDPSILRHRPVPTNNPNGWKDEVLADVIAGHLYAPDLLGDKYTYWIENTLPSLIWQ